MRKTILIMAALFLLAACDNVEQFSQPIQTLAGNWEQATSQVSEFAGALETQQQKLQGLMNSMQTTDELESQLSEENRQKLMENQETFAAHQATLQNLNAQLEAFLSKWQEGSETLNSLQKGLESGTLPSDVQEKITSLQDMVSNVEPTLADWKTQLAEAQQGINTATVQYKEILSSTM